MSEQWLAFAVNCARIRALPWSAVYVTVGTCGQSWLVAGWRAWRPLLPATFRQMPKALAADRRVGGSRQGPARLGR